MGKDNISIIFGVIYAVCVGLVWMVLFLPFFSYYSRYINSAGGPLTFFGAAILVPSFILVIIFISSTDSTTTWQVGSGLGIFGWLLTLSGSIVNLRIYSPTEPLPVLLLIISLVLIGSGLFLFIRIWNYEEFTKDRPKLIWGLINIGITFLYIFLLFASAFGIPFYLPMSNFFSVVALYGLVPAFILNWVFFPSAMSSGSGKVGFGFGIAGWVLGLIGASSTFSYPWYDFEDVLLGFLLILGITVSGIFLFTRLWGADDEYLVSSGTIIRRPESPPYSGSPPTVKPLGPPCPKCDRATTYIAQYDRYYCYDCREYV